jgi:hypothetical protein
VNAWHCATFHSIALGVYARLFCPVTYPPRRNSQLLLMVAGPFQIFDIANNSPAALKTVLRTETHQHTMEITAALNPDCRGT